MLIEGKAPQLKKSISAASFQNPFLNPLSLFIEKKYLGVAFWKPFRYKFLVLMATRQLHFGRRLAELWESWQKQLTHSVTQAFVSSTSILSKASPSNWILKQSTRSYPWLSPLHHSHLPLLSSAQILAILSSSYWQSMLKSNLTTWFLD